MSSAPDPQQTAEAVRDAMQAKDAVLHALGMQVQAVGPGTATVAMTVRADMLNGFGICHGGLVCTLADTAFAYACNSRDQLTVASGFSMDLLAPSHAGDLLTATARELHKRGRSGLYDIAVANQHGHRVAEFRGRSTTLQDRAVVGGSPITRQR